MIKKNTAGNVRLPGISDNYPLISLEFKNTSDKVDFKLPETNDFTKFDTISFEIMQDSTSPINKGKNQMLDITLTDKNGKFHTISTPKDTYSLQYQPGKMTSIALRDEYAKTMYSNITPLSTLMIPLSEFNNKVDLSKISTIEISPSKSTGQGSFILQSMYLSSINNNSQAKGLNLNSIIIYVLAFAVSFIVLFILTKKIIKHKAN